MLGFLYTVYQQVAETDYSISLLKSSTYPEIRDAEIIIVSTSQEDVWSDLAEKYGAVLIHFRGAPSDGTRWKSKSNPHGPVRTPSVAPSWPEGTDPPGGLWRYNWLTMRILLSMELGIQTARTLGIKGLLHFHSDSYWGVEQGNIINDYNVLIGQSKMLMVDVAQQQENGVLPKGMRFCPESLFFNVDECYKYQYGFNFSDIWTNPNSNGDFVNIYEFCCQDWCASEALLGQYAYYCLTGYNVFTGQDELDSVWYDKIAIRQCRDHHGHFANGFSNIETRQPMRG